MKENYYNNEIYYRKNEFKPDRLTLVFAHGVSGSSSAWWPYEKIFENKYNILNYDIRGHGMSKKYPDYKDYEVKNFVSDLYDLVSFLNIKKFVLISNSFAGLIHLEYFKKYPEEIIANIFSSPEVYLGEGIKGKVMRGALNILRTLVTILPSIPRPRGHVNYKKYIGSTDWSVGRNLIDIRNTGFRAHFYTLRQSMNLGQVYELEKVTAPTLVIHGEKDTMVPIKNAIRLTQEIKNAEFKSIPNVDHNTVHNAVKIMSEEIEVFLEKYKNLLY